MTVVSTRLIADGVNDENFFCWQGILIKRYVVATYRELGTVQFLFTSVQYRNLSLDGQTVPHSSKKQRKMTIFGFLFVLMGLRTTTVAFQHASSFVSRPRTTLNAKFDDEQMAQLAELLGEFETMMDEKWDKWTKEMDQKRAESEKRMDERMGRLETKVGGLYEYILRKEAERHFGESFAEEYLARSLYDLVNLLSSIRINNVISSVFEDQFLRADELVVRSNLRSLVAPTVSLFLDQIDPTTIKGDAEKKMQLEQSLSDAKLLFQGGSNGVVDEETQYRTITRLITATEKARKYSISKTLIRLKNGFGESSNGVHFIDEKKLLKSDGPGLLLFELSSRGIDPTSFQSKVNITTLVEELEFDMRGSITLLNYRVTVTCGEFVSSYGDVPAAKTRCAIRTRVLMHALSLLYQNTDGTEYFTNKARIGRIIVPKTEVETHDWSDSRENEEDHVCYYVHRF